MQESEDSNPYRQRTLKLQRIKKDAVPSKFPNCPSYLSNFKVEPRGASTSSSARREREAEKAEAAAEAFLIADEISSLTELNEKLDYSCLPSGVTVVKEEDEEITFLGLQKDSVAGPTVAYSLLINSSLQITLYSHGVKLSTDNVTHISAFGKVCSCAEVLNIVSFLKAKSEESLPTNDTIEYCATLLESLLPNCDDVTGRKLTFITEQLRLATKDTRHRRYSGMRNAIQLRYFFD